MDTSDHKLIPVGDLLQGSWDIFGRRINSFLKFTLFQFVMTLPVILLWWLGYLLFVAYPSQYLYLIGYVPVGVAIWGALYYLQLRARISMMYIPVSEYDRSFKEYFALSRGRVGQYFWVQLLADLIILGGFVLFVFPGIVFGIAISFCWWVYLLENKTGMAAIRQSLEYTQQRLAAIWGRMLLLSIIIGVVGNTLIAITKGSLIVSVLMGFVVSLVAGGFSVCFNYLLYRSAAASFYSGSSPRDWQANVFLILGLVVFVVVPLGVITYLVASYLN